MLSDGVATAIARWSAPGVSPAVSAFATEAVKGASPKSPARARSLLYAAHRLGSFATSVGLSLDPDVVLSQSVIERFILSEGSRLSQPTRRTLRSNLRFIARSVLLNQVPGPVPLSRERAKAPYTRQEIDAYLALADAQPTQARRMRLAGLVCLGAGAGLMGADLRGVRGTDVDLALRRCGRVCGFQTPPGGACSRRLPRAAARVLQHSPEAIT